MRVRTPGLAHQRKRGCSSIAACSKFRSNISHCAAVTPRRAMSAGHILPVHTGAAGAPFMGHSIKLVMPLLLSSALTCARTHALQTAPCAAPDVHGGAVQPPPPAAVLSHSPAQTGANSSEGLASAQMAQVSSRPRGRKVTYTYCLPGSRAPPQSCV